MPIVIAAEVASIARRHGAHSVHGRIVLLVQLDVLYVNSLDIFPAVVYVAGLVSIEACLQLDSLVLDQVQLKLLLFELPLHLVVKLLLSLNLGVLFLALIVVAFLVAHIGLCFIS